MTQVEAHGELPRKRVRRFEVQGQPRFITFSTYQRAPLFVDVHTRDEFVAELMRSRLNDGFLLHALVVMPEHIHLVMTPTAVAISRSLANLKRRSAEAALARWRMSESPMLEQTTVPDGSRRFWQRGGGYDRNIRDHHELIEKVIYTEANPVRRGMVSMPADWRWSSACVRAKLAPEEWVVDRIE